MCDCPQCKYQDRLYDDERLCKSVTTAILFKEVSLRLKEQSAGRCKILQQQIEAKMKEIQTLESKEWY